jgi:hypothetical protein
VGDEFGAATLNQVAGLSYDVFQEFEKILQPSFLIDYFGNGMTQGRIGLNVAGGAPSARRDFVLHWRGCHAKMLHPSEAESKGQRLRRTLGGLSMPGTVEPPKHDRLQHGHASESG